MKNGSSTYYYSTVLSNQNACTNYINIDNFKYIINRIYKYQ